MIDRAKLLVDKKHDVIGRKAVIARQYSDPKANNVQ